MVEGDWLTYILLANYFVGVMTMFCRDYEHKRRLAAHTLFQTVTKFHNIQLSAYLE